MKLEIEPTTQLSCPHPACNASFTIIEALGKEVWKELVNASSADDKEQRRKMEKQLRAVIEDEQRIQYESENSLLKEIIHKDNQKIQKISFIITDFKNEVLVNYEGILPDLFKEGQGVVVEGILIDHLSVNAINVLAKHDENYMPPELDFVNTSEKGKN